MEKIGYAGSKWYGRIDEVYVPPSEYEEMAKTLHERKILFIIGTPEYGKTYTAVRLMWEFYNRGYEPRWIVGGEPTERIEVRRKLEDIGAVLKPGRVIYFEDPFGKTRYERREGLEREIGTILVNVRQVEDVYVIITSREEVFKEFEKEKLSTTEFKEFKNKLNIKKPSYDYEKRREILLDWAEEESCKWPGNEELKDFVLEFIMDEKTLPTPLSIREFAVATFDIEKDNELKEELKKKSQDTTKAFAKEIKNMSDDKILFLSFLFITGYFEVEFVRATYQELVEELNLKNAWGFDRALDWFKNDKINIGCNYISFSHPSYSEALEHLLVEDGHITRINREIFSKLLLKLSEKDEANWRVGLWEDCSSIRWADCSVGRAVANNFDKLPEDVRNEVLFKLSENDIAAWYVARAVADNFDKLPDVRNTLLLNLSEKKWTADGIARAVTNNFDKLPEDVRNLLFKRSEKGMDSWYVARAVADNFDKLPDDVRNKLLLKLSERVLAAETVAWTVACNFDNLPDDVRNKLLVKLSEKDGAAGNVARVVADNFDKIPDNMRNLLDRLQKPLQQVIEDLLRNKECLQVLRLISKASSKINPDFVLKILNELSGSDDETVRIETVKLLETMGPYLAVQKMANNAEDEYIPR